MIESKIVSVVMFIVGAFFLLLGFKVFSTIRMDSDKEEIIDSLVILLFNLIFSFIFIIGGIQLWQI